MKNEITANAKRSFTLAFDAQVFTELKELADSSSISIAAMVRHAVDEYVDRNGGTRMAVTPEAVQEIKGFLMRTLEFSRRTSRGDEERLGAISGFEKVILNFCPDSPAAQSIDDLLESADALYEQMRDNPKF